MDAFLSGAKDVPAQDTTLFETTVKQGWQSGQCVRQSSMSQHAYIVKQQQYPAGLLLQLLAQHDTSNDQDCTVQFLSLPKNMFMPGAACLPCGCGRSERKRG